MVESLGNQHIQDVRIFNLVWKIFLIAFHSSISLYLLQVVQRYWIFRLIIAPLVRNKSRTDTMLKGISPLISPDLLAMLARMGHGDELVLADAHFPAETHNNRVLRADGVPITGLLEAILPLFELDSYVESPLVMMDPVKGDPLDLSVERVYLASIQKTNPSVHSISRIERFAFYERTRSAFAVVVTGELAKYGNIILRKGVTQL
jgi:L-fucose mutarotase